MEAGVADVATLQCDQLAGLADISQTTEYSSSESE